MGFTGRFRDLASLDCELSPTPANWHGFSLPERFLFWPVVPPIHPWQPADHHRRGDVVCFSATTRPELQIFLQPQLIIIDAGLKQRLIKNGSGGTHCVRVGVGQSRQPSSRMPMRTGRPFPKSQLINKKETNYAGIPFPAKLSPSEEIFPSSRADQSTAHTPLDLQRKVACVMNQSYR